MVMRCLAALLLAGWALAAEVILELPDPAVPEAVLGGQVRIVDAPGEVARLILPEVAGLEWQTAQRLDKLGIVNGRRTSEVTFKLRLRAAAIGTLQLPPVVAVLADGTRLSSAPRTLRVDRGDARLVGEAFAEASFDPPTIVPGQPTRLVLRLCFNQNQNGSIAVNPPGVSPPEGAISLGELGTEQGSTFDARGQAWATMTYSMPFTHATPGSYTVRGQQEYQLQHGNGFLDVRVRRKQVAIPPATLTVEALPAAGRPAGFAGLIGPLSATASLERERVATGEGTVLTIAVTCRQTDLLRRPELRLAGAQLYPKDEDAAAGTRTFRWDVVPAVPGTVAISPVAFAYFDPGSRSYRSAETPALTLTVLPGRTRDLGIVGDLRQSAAAAPAATPAPGLPPPLRGAAGVRVPAWGVPLALGGGLLAGLAGWAGRTLLRRRAPHRGRALRAAGRDPAALAAALAALRPALATAGQRAAAEAVQAAIDRARFGGEALPDLEAHIAALERIA